MLRLLDIIIRDPRELEAIRRSWQKVDLEIPAPPSDTVDSVREVVSHSAHKVATSSHEAVHHAASHSHEAVSHLADVPADAPSAPVADTLSQLPDTLSAALREVATAASESASRSPLLVAAIALSVVLLLACLYAAHKVRSKNSRK